MDADAKLSTIAASRPKIAERAYQIWEAQGKPAGRDLDHWLQAETEISAEGEAPVLPKMAGPAKN